MKRREFIRCGTMGAAALGVSGRAPAAEGPAVTSGVVREPARDVPVAGESDVLVCGGGPAGVAAAVAAARAGASTRLLECHGGLGGIWTSGLLSWILDYGNKPGFMAELVKRLDERGARGDARDESARNAYDAEVMKLLLEELCAEAKVEVHLHTRVCAAVTTANRRIDAAIAESRSGREAFRARVYIDATGDGDLGAAAGCGFDLGHPETGATQPMTLMALVTGLDPEAIRPFYRGGDWATPKDLLRAEMERGGASPSYNKPTLFRIRDGLFALMANHEYGVKGTSAADVTRATLRARRELHRLIDGLRSLGGAWKNIRIVATPEQIGVREGRRIHGRYTVTQDDLREGRMHPDAVCRVTFGIDVHSTDPGKTKGIEKAGFKSKPYDIPLRALIAKDLDNLVMAGRCISGDFIAHSSYRVTGNAVALGEAAGRAVAMLIPG